VTRDVSPSEALQNLAQVLRAGRTLRLLLRKLSHERVLMRASGLAFDSLLAIVPFMAVSMGSVAVLGGRETLRDLLRELAPLGSVLSVRYVPLASVALHQWLTPFMLLFLLLYLVFRRMPALRISRRAAAVGASSAALILATAKLGFGIYAQLAVSLHALWGAIAFVPLFLVWILLCWYAVLSAAAVAAVVNGELALREAVEVARRERPRRRRSRLRQRMLARPSQRAPQ
jgi:uncharacterized BrkB/YihY/UPF0761 family membrane protein